MFQVFLLSLFTTFLIVRISAHLLHDKKNYGTQKEKSYTLTGFVRHVTGKEIHHIHFGIALLLFTLVFFEILSPTTKFSLLGISLSLIIDQIIPSLDKTKNYFHTKRLLESIALHGIVATIAIINLY
jgi:hypothetical protein